MTTDWYILRCNYCHIIIGIQEMIDDHGTVEYCRKCGTERIDTEKVKDWKYGHGWFEIEKRYADDKEYD